MLMNQTLAYYRATGEVRMLELGESGTVAEDFIGVQLATDYTGKGSRFTRLMCVFLPAGPRWNLWTDNPHKEELPPAFRIFQVLSTTRTGCITADGVESPDMLAVRFLIDIAIPEEGMPVRRNGVQASPDAPGRTEGTKGDTDAGGIS